MKDYTLPERFSASQKELLHVLYDKEAVSVFQNGETMSPDESVALNRTIKEKLKEGASERNQDRIHRMPTFSDNYHDTIEWVASVTQSRAAFAEAFGEDIDADVDPMVEPGQDSDLGNTQRSRGPSLG